MVQLPQHITLIEVGPRDGLQAESPVVPTSRKESWIRGLAGAGLKHIQVTSFVHPRKVPQMADAEELCGSLSDLEDVVLSGLALNRKGVERAIQAGLAMVDVSISTSDIHSRKNMGLGLEQAMAELRAMIQMAKAAGLRVRAGLQNVFGCNYEGLIPEERIKYLTACLLEEDIQFFSLADSTGRAGPKQINETLSALKPMYGDLPVILHLHDTRGLGLVNLLAAMNQGVTHFDVALAGMGGCPFIPGASGNIATADVLHLLETMGIEAGVNPKDIIHLSRAVADFFGKRFPGKVHRLPSTALEMVHQVR